MAVLVKVEIHEFPIGFVLCADVLAEFDEVLFPFIEGRGCGLA